MRPAARARACPLVAHRSLPGSPARGGPPSSPGGWRAMPGARASGAGRPPAGPAQAPAPLRSTRLSPFCRAESEAECPRAGCASVTGAAACRATPPCCARTGLGGPALLLSLACSDAAGSRRLMLHGRRRGWTRLAHGHARRSAWQQCRAPAPKPTAWAPITTPPRGLSCPCCPVKGLQPLI